MQGYAVQDFNERYDLHYAKILYGLSGMRQYQLREVLKKLYNIYLKKVGEISLLMRNHSDIYLMIKMTMNQN